MYMMHVMHYCFNPGQAQVFCNRASNLLSVGTGGILYLDLPPPYLLITNGHDVGNCSNEESDHEYAVRDLYRSTRLKNPGSARVLI